MDEKVAKLTISLTLSGAPAVEVRRVCDNLNIGLSTFARKAILAELKSMGISVQ